MPFRISETRQLLFSMLLRSSQFETVEQQKITQTRSLAHPPVRDTPTMTVVRTRTKHQRVFKSTRAMLLTVRPHAAGNVPRFDDLPMRQRDEQTNRRANNTHGTRDANVTQFVTPEVCRRIAGASRTPSCRYRTAYKTVHTHDDSHQPSRQKQTERHISHQHKRRVVARHHYLVKRRNTKKQTGVYDAIATKDEKMRGITN
jgi:hypothetical protein